MWFPINYDSHILGIDLALICTELKSCFTFGAGADGGVVLDVAVCAAAADLGGPEAGVLAVQVHAGLLVVAVVVLGALRVAPGLRAADEVVGAGALGAVVQRAAVGALAARVLVAAGRAAELLALLVRRAVVVALALVTATLRS